MTSIIKHTVEVAVNLALGLVLALALFAPRLLVGVFIALAVYGIADMLLSGCSFRRRGIPTPKVSQRIRDTKFLRRRT